MSHHRRIVALVAALGVVMGAGGIFAAFTSSDNAQQNVDTGTVHVAITNDANTGHITDSWSNRAAGDTITRTFTVTNTSSLALSELTLTITAPASDDLIANVQGLRDQVWTCDQAYTTNTCGGTETVRQGYAAIAEENGVPFSIKDASDLTPGTNVFVKALVSLPYGAGNSLQDKSTVITYTINALQRDGVDNPLASRTVPDAPNAADINVTTNNDGPVYVAFTPPAANGNAIDQYRITTHSTPTYVFGTSSPIEVTGLPVGDHTITLAAHNSQGWSAESGSVSFTVSGGNPALTLRASVSAAGGDPAPDTYGDQSSQFPSVSADGRYVMFYSYGTDLVAGDTNNSADVFLRDTHTGTTTLVSADPSGNFPDASGGSYPGPISPNGHFAVFYSDADNLVASPSQAFTGQQNIYERNLQTGVTTLVSLTDTGAVSDGYAYAPTVSNDGRYVVFDSTATNMITGQSMTNGNQHIFVRDTVANTTTQIDQTPGGLADDTTGSADATITPDGHYVAFDSGSDNLVAGDTNGTSDVFIRDLQSGTTTRISTGPGGAQDNCGSNQPSITDNGQAVAFVSCASNWNTNPDNLNEGWIWHNGTGLTPILSASGTPIEYGAFSPTLSGDGRIVIFGSYENVIPGVSSADGPGNPVLFAQNTSNGDTEVVSTDVSNLGYSSSSPWFISTTGRFVAFISQDALVSSDHNNDIDVYLRDRGGR